MPTLKVILKVAKEQLIQKDAVREKAQKKMRKTTSLSKQAILLMHQKKYGKAERLIEDAKEKIDELKNMANEFPDIIYSGMFSSALQEYAEATIFMKLVEESRFVSAKEINVPLIEYILGLADTIGEIRRLTLDALREGKVTKGEKLLEIMDEIYVELTGMDEAYILVPGLRRKCDVARKIIEITRGDITQEVRRKALRDYLKQLDQTQNKKRRD